MHHTAGSRTDDVWLDADRDGVEDDELREVIRLEQVGQARFGCGMSYTFLVPPRGHDAYQGHTMGRQGAHTFGHNDRGRGICVIGNYDIHELTGPQVRVIAEIMVTEHRAGRHATHRLNGGHRDSGTSTACPGSRAHRRIGEINALADQLWRGEDDDVNDEEHRWLRECHHELTLRLPSRSAHAGPKPFADTMLGNTLNADGRAHEALVEVQSLRRELPDIIRRELAAFAKSLQPPDPPKS